MRRVLGSDEWARGREIYLEGQISAHLLPFVRVKWYNFDNKETAGAANRHAKNSLGEFE